MEIELRLIKIMMIEIGNHVLSMLGGCFFLKQKTAYEMRISDWSSDVCSSDLAINGMLASLDPHSSFLDERDFTNLRTQTDGAYGGLGLTVTMEDGAVKIVTPTEDTPAFRAGLKAGDYITHLDGVLIYGGTLDEAVAKMRGTPGNPTKLKVVRPGRDKPFDVTVKRENIQLRPVKWEAKGQVGYININT